MVGIVIVSHSVKIAEGVKELVMQMAKEGQPIFTAGGTNTGEIGTDPIQIQKAVESANQGDGVVIFADLGSAIMSIDIAKEMIDDKLAKSVYLANAPLVEGAIAATIEAAMGSSVQDVLLTAQKARIMEKVL